ncbi:MAG: DUF1501 domain-containing protein [Anaerolineae bacterium]|nr:MAG: DUF1501 domain-containing protein [Anaerolineae bacterium]
MTVSRRNMLKTTAALSVAGAMQTLWPRWMPRLAFAQEGVRGDVLVCIFLRGGADSLNIIVPFGDDDYYKARPTLAIPRPDSRAENRVLQLDDFFGLNPDMKALAPLFTGGHLAAIHAVGAPNVSRSHFEAMDLLERGTDGKSGASSGWLGRHLMITSGATDSPLRAVGWGENLQTSLRGYVNATALRSIVDFHLHGDTSETDRMTAALATMYQQSDAPLDMAANATLQALETVRQIDVDKYRPINGAKYTDTDFGRALRQTAALIKAEVGLEVACVDLGNFDTHITQGVTVHGGVGLFPGLVVELADNLRAFHDDLLDYIGRVTVVTMSEFGRRVQENGAGGTDHGHGGVMLVMSEHVTPAPVTATWPGLNPNFLADGDLEITMDYRDVLGEILQNRTGNTQVEAVFEGHSIKPVGIIQKNT